MRWGLIARSETDRGIGIQTHAIYENLRPDRTLVVIDQKSGYRAHPSLYVNATTVQLKHGPYKNTLDQQIVRDWWAGLDVVITVETLYDWDLIGWAQADGVATVVQGNPEFWMATNPQPDVWTWPTTWRLEHLPTGPVIPVPVPERPIIAADPHDGGLFRALHIAGSQTLGNRNGTDIVATASRKLGNGGIKFTVYSQAPIPPVFRAVTKGPAENRWDMYRNQHALVLPRRYGGLCLPALEAMASGLAVVMPDCSPNHDWYPVRHILGDIGRTLKMQTGEVETFEVYGNQLASEVLSLARDRAQLNYVMGLSRQWADENRWSVHAQTYYDLLEDASRSRR